MSVAPLPLPRVTPLKDSLAQARRSVLFAEQIADPGTRGSLMRVAVKQIDRASWLIAQGVSA